MVIFNRKKLALILCAGLFIFMSGCVNGRALAATADCTAKNAAYAEEKSTNLGSWQEAYAFYNKYGSCDDGAIAEGYSESIARLLVDKWATLHELQKISKRDQGFANFFKKHIDESLNLSDLRIIQYNALNECPVSSEDMCLGISTQSYRAINLSLSGE